MSEEGWKAGCFVLMSPLIMLAVFGLPICLISNAIGSALGMISDEFNVFYAGVVFLVGAAYLLVYLLALGIRKITK